MRARQSRGAGAISRAWAVRDFRLLWLGNNFSMIGTWMQNVLLGAYARERFGSASAVGLIIFAQLGPVLVLSIPSGLIADRVRRRPFIAAMQIEQMLLSCVLAVIVRGRPSMTAVFLVVLGIGIGGSLTGPSFQSAVPSMVGRENLAGALSLNSVGLNGSRVVGPILTAILTSFGVTVSGIFFINAGTYLVVIGALCVIKIPSNTARRSDNGWRALTGGLRYAKNKKVVGSILLGMASFSMFSLPFVGQFASIAKSKFHIDTRGSTYQWLYATWGLGACLGALSIGTIFSQIGKRKLIFGGLFGFAVTLATYAWVTSLTVGFVVLFFLGWSYFTVATSLLTVLQTNTDDDVRGRIGALWLLVFGGTVPIGNLIAGPIIDRTGARPVMLFGAAWACVLLLIWRAQLRRAEMLRTTQPVPEMVVGA